MDTSEEGPPHHDHHHLYHHLSLETKKQIQSQKHCGILPEAVDIVEKIYLIGRLLTLHEIR